jgi:hypothetical protein
VLVKVARVLLAATLLGAVVVLWGYAFRVPFLNLFVGPLDGVLLAVAVSVGVPGRRGRPAQYLAFALYLTSLVGVAGATAARLLPWLPAYHPAIAGWFLGIRGEGLLGAAGIAVGAVIAGVGPRARKGKREAG